MKTDVSNLLGAIVVVAIATALLRDGRKTTTVINALAGAFQTSIRSILGKNG